MLYGKVRNSGYDCVSVRAVIDKDSATAEARGPLRRETEMSKKLVSFAITALLATTGFAQSATTTGSTSNSATSATNPNHRTINQRKRNQQRRIDQGEDSGQLTRREDHNLEKKEHALNQEERDMRKLDNGKLTAQDRKTINKQQNKLSKNIYRDKHNARKRKS